MNDLNVTLALLIASRPIARIDRSRLHSRAKSAGSVARHDRKSKLICAPCTSIHLVALVFTFVPRREKASNIASFGSFIHRSLWTRTIWSPTCIEPTVSLRPLRAEQVRLSFRASFSYFISRRHDSEQGNTDACLKTLGAVSLVRSYKGNFALLYRERIPSAKYSVKLSRDWFNLNVII